MEGWVPLGVSPVTAARWWSGLTSSEGSAGQGIKHGSFLWLAVGSGCQLGAQWGCHPRGAPAFGLSEWLGLHTARWLISRGSIPEPACPRQDAERISWRLCHSQLVKAVQGPPGSKGAGACLDHRAEKHAGRRERLFHLSLEDIICPYHCGNSSPGWPSVFLVSPCPSFYNPFSPTPNKTGPCQLRGRSHSPLLSSLSSFQVSIREKS